MKMTLNTQAKPTLTHMALAKLVQKEKVLLQRRPYFVVVLDFKNQFVMVAFVRLNNFTS